MSDCQARKYTKSSFSDNDLAHFYKSGGKVDQIHLKDYFSIRKVELEVKVDSS